MADVFAGANGALPQPPSSSALSSTSYVGGQTGAHNQSQSQGYQGSSAPLSNELSLSAPLSPPHRSHARIPTHTHVQHTQRVTGSMSGSGTASPSTSVAGVHSPGPLSASVNPGPSASGAAASSHFASQTSVLGGGGSSSITTATVPAGANTSTNSVAEAGAADANLLPGFLLPGGLNGEVRVREGADQREGEVGMFSAGPNLPANRSSNGNGNGNGMGNGANQGSEAGSPAATLLDMRERRASGGPFGRRFTLPTPQPHPVLFPGYVGSDGGSPEVGGSADPASLAWLSPGSNAPPGSSSSASEPYPGSASGSVPTHPLSPGSGRYAPTASTSSSVGNVGSNGNSGNYGTSSGLDSGAGSAPGSGSSPYMHSLQDAHAHGPRPHGHGHATARMQLDSPRTLPAPFGLGLNGNHNSPASRASRTATKFGAQMNMSMNDHSGTYAQAQRSPARLPLSLPMHLQQHPRTYARTHSSPNSSSLAYQTPSPVSGPNQQQFSPPPLYSSSGISVSRPTSSAGSIGGRISISGWAPSPGPSSSANGTSPAFEQVLNEDMPHLSGSFSKSPLTLPMSMSLSAANFSPASSSSISINAESGHGHQHSHHQTHGFGHASSMLPRSNSHLLNTPGSSTPSLINNNNSSASFTTHNAAGLSPVSSSGPGVGSGTHPTNTAPSPSYSTSTSHSDPPSGASSHPLLSHPLSPHRQPSLSFGGYQQQSLPSLIQPSDLSYTSTPTLRNGNPHGSEKETDTAVSMAMQIGLGHGDLTPGTGTGPTPQVQLGQANSSKYTFILFFTFFFPSIFSLFPCFRDLPLVSACRLDHRECLNLFTIIDLDSLIV